ncbi:hypothetical protein [Marinospirillum sp.]|uniref:hypothetical protein n=1 Tax=Marinospirillum sp. TaxID=2183934 RepID=UPI00385166BA
MDETKNKRKKTNKKPFKQTRELVRMALNDGWTQTEIAKVCRLGDKPNHQSVVSDWSRGKKNATEQQLRPLLEIYGSRLRRNTFKVYRGQDPETQEDIYYRVEGKVILSHTLNIINNKGKLPWLRIIIHWQSQDKFIVVVQDRSCFPAPNGKDGDLALHPHTVKNDHNGQWVAIIREKKGVGDLLSYVKILKENFIKDFDLDAITLPFLTVEALLKQGIEVDGVVKYDMEW